MITKKVISTPEVNIALPTYSLGFEVKGGTQIFISGCLALDTDGQVVGKGDIVAQTRKVCENIRQVMAACGGTMDDIVKITNYFVNADDLVPATKARVEYFSEPYPASTSVIVKGLVNKDCLVEIDAIAVLDR